MARFIPHSEWLAGMPGTDPDDRPYALWRPQSTSQPLNAPGADRVKGTAIHYPGSAPGTATYAFAERDPLNYVRGIHRGHRNRQPSGFDLGYGFVVVPNGDIYEGRAWYRQAAHGGDSDPGDENEQYLAIQLPVDTEHPHPNPSAAQVASTRNLIAEQRRRYPGANEISDHRTVDGPGNTSCPGEVLHRMVVTGVFEPDSGQIEEDFMTPEDKAYLDAKFAGLDEQIWARKIDDLATVSGSAADLMRKGATSAGVLVLNSKIDGLTNAVNEIDPAALTAAVTAAVEAALENVTLHADLSPEDIAAIAAASAAATVAEIAS
jgi:hypothetical protein